MAEGDRLGALHMGEAGHHGGKMELGLHQQGALQGPQAFLGAAAGVADPQPEIGHHLIVARARRVQPPGGRAYDFRQPRLDIQMNVFQGAFEDEFALGDLLGRWRRDL